MPKYNDKDLQAAITKEAKRQRLLQGEIEDFAEAITYAYERYNNNLEVIKRKMQKRIKLEKEQAELERLRDEQGDKFTKEQAQRLAQLTNDIEGVSRRIRVFQTINQELVTDYSGLRRVMDNLADEAEKAASAEEKAQQRKIAAAQRYNANVMDNIHKEVQDVKERQAFENSLQGMSKKRRAAALKAFDNEKKQEEELQKAQKKVDALRKYISERKTGVSKEKREELQQAEEDLANQEKEAEIATKQREVTEKAVKERRKHTSALGKELDNIVESWDKSYQAAGGGVYGFANAVGSLIDAKLDIYTKYMSSMTARLQGGTTSYGSIVDNVAARLAISPFVKQADVMQNIQNLVSSGVAFNVEQRGFLMTLADKIAPTFEANSEALLRLVRLQGEDTTAQRLGLEAALTRSLNATFKDTAYLNNLFDTIRDAIFDAESQLDKESATEFEYNTQKWLSSIYSVGGSSSFITNLAQGINMLGTGDVTGLAGNESLQTLLAMALSRSGSGLTYSDVLLGGLNASSVNEVLYQVIEYLQEIEQNSRDNMVIRSQYARLFGMSVADFAALTNLSDDMMKGLRGQNVNYQGFTDELTSQFWALANPGSGRLSVGEMVQTALDNVLTGMAAGIAKSPALLATWQINNMVEDLTGGINIPAFSVFGTGIDLNANLNQLIKLGIGGFSLMSQIGNVISSLGSLGGLNLDSWVTENNMRGGGFVATTAGVSTGLSESVRYQGSGDYGDMEQETLQTATTRAQEVGEITSAGVDTTKKTSDDIWQAMFSEDSPYAVRVKLVEVDPSILSVPVRITDQGLGSSEQEALYIRSGLYSSDTP